MYVIIVVNDCGDIMEVFGPFDSQETAYELAFDKQLSSKVRWYYQVYALLGAEQL